MVFWVAHGGHRSPKVEHQNGVEGAVGHSLSRFAGHFESGLVLFSGSSKY